MRCKPEFITAQKKHADHTTFSAFVRNLTPSALSLNVPLGTLDRLPQMTPTAHQALRDRNRRDYTVSPAKRAAPNPVATSMTSPILPPDEDEWSSGTRSP